MIRHLVLENFKAFGDRTSISLAPITLIYGQNSAGKSSILQSLNLLKQSRGTRDSQALLLPRSENGLVDLGSFREMVFDHELSRVVRIRVVVDGYGQRMPFLDRRPRSITQGLEFAFSRRSASEEISLERLDLCGANPHGFIATFAPVSQTQDPASETEDELSRLNEYLGAGYLDIVRSNYREYELVELGNDARNNLFEVFQRIRQLRIDAQRLQRSEDQLEIISRQRRSNKETTDQRSTETAQLWDLLLNSGNHTDKDLAKWIGDNARSTKLLLDGFIPIGSDRPRRLSSRDIDLSRFLHTELHEIQGLTDVIGSLAASAGRLIDNTLNSMFPIGPFRRAPARWYVFTGTTPRHVGYQGNLLPDMLFRKQKLVDETNEWLEKLDLGYKIKVDPLGSRSSDLFELRLFDTRRDRPVSVGLSDVGFGISQILPLVVESLVARNQVITVEQPEVHIHPKLQADLGDLLAYGIRRPRYNQFLIETHSEHLALRIQKLVRTKQLRPEDVSIVFVERGRNGSRVIPIRLDEDGDFVDEFPGGFFPERLREL